MQMPSSSSSKSSKLLQVLFFSIALLTVSNRIILRTVVDCKEVQGTDEWTLLEENDTVAAGLHIRMDLTTGEKWVKKISDDDTDEESAINDGSTTTTMKATVNSDGGVVVTTARKEEGEISNSTTTPEEKERLKQMLMKKQQEKYDYDMMHRTLSGLPADEIERIGGLPELPEGKVSDPKVRMLFEKRMKEIWVQRQEELKELEHLLANFPEMLKTWIQQIQDYMQDPFLHLTRINFVGDGSTPTITTIANSFSIYQLLEDLEYELTDIDMTRDFHTLGGWALLSSLLSDKVHQSNYYYDNYTIGNDHYNKVNLIQANAAWVIGTAVKNTEEFSNYCIEEMLISTASPETTAETAATTKTTPLKLLLSQLIQVIQFLSDNNGQIEEYNYPMTNTVIVKLHKILYALGSCLRGNRLVQTHFSAPIAVSSTRSSTSTNMTTHEKKSGPQILLQLFDQINNINHKKKTKDDNNSIIDTKNTKKIRKRIFNIIDDVISDIQLHTYSSKSDQMDRIIIKEFTSYEWCAGMVNQLKNNFRKKEDNENITANKELIKTLTSILPHCSTEEERKKKIETSPSSLENATELQNLQKAHYDLLKKWEESNVDEDEKLSLIESKFRKILL